MQNIVFGIGQAVIATSAKQKIIGARVWQQATANAAYQCNWGAERVGGDPTV